MRMKRGAIFVCLTRRAAARRPRAREGEGLRLEVVEVCPLYVAEDAAHAPAPCASHYACAEGDHGRMSACGEQCNCFSGNRAQGACGVHNCQDGMHDLLSDGTYTCGA